MEYNEKEILEALRNEKAKYHAFSQLVEHYREPLYWRIRRIVIAHEDANDVLQNTLAMQHKHCCRRQSQHCLKYSEQSLICVTLTK